MALTDDFTPPEFDAFGRRFVIHKPTGVKYLIRERDHPKGHVTSYTRVSSTVSARPQAAVAPKAPQSHHRPREDDNYARATFIEGTEP